MDPSPGHPAGIRLIAGLGNPGMEYAGTRHNAGFAFIKRFLAKMPGSPERIHAFDSWYWPCLYAGKRLFLQTPLTYMNLSGKAVAALAAHAQIAPEEILVVHDDMDLAPGRIRLRTGGGSGGHHGVESIMETLGSADFMRLRIGIGKMENGHGSAEFVLSGFPEEERGLFDQVLDLATDAAVLALRRGFALAMTQFNGRDLAPREEPPEKPDRHDTINETQHSNGNGTIFQEVQT